jgi:hypothetical protein
MWEVALMNHILLTVNREINILGKEMLCFFCGENGFLIIENGK